jgi:DNA-binding NtrC family response regulator
MAKILSIASTEILKTTRQLILEDAGYEVVSFSSVPLIQELEKAGKPDLAVLGHGFRGSDKRKLALALNQLFPGIPILEMCIHSPEIPGADFIVNNSPEHLVSAISEILAGRRVRGFIS